MSIAVLALLSSCSCEAPLDEGEVLGDGFASIQAIDAQTVDVAFSRNLDRGSVNESVFEIASFTVVPPEVVEIASAEATSDTVVRIGTGPLKAGLRYTLNVDGLKDSQGRVIAGSINFIASGAGGLVTVEIAIPDVETARLHEQLAVLATVSASGAFSEELQAYPVVDEGARFVTRLDVLVDAARTLDSGDDGDTLVDRRPYAVLVVDGAGRMASALVRFVVPSEDAPRTVDVDVLPPLEIIDPVDNDPLPPPPDDANPADGVRQVRVVVDDRASRELVSPELKLAARADGTFDATFPQTLALTAMTGDHEGYWEAIVGVRVDPNRVAEGATDTTFPYFGFLVEEGQPYEALDVAIVAPDETPTTVRLSLGNPDWTPVTFRVDVGGAYLNTSGSARGVYPDEAVFLTGEWQQAADALGNNCGDAFTGGENACLEMRELSSRPGVWTRTLWLPGGRPYGWKVVRCTAGYGCGDLNNLVSSSGRAFATVMKNLASDNVDAFADPNVQIIDPIAPGEYADGTVYQGQGIGLEPDPSGTPDGSRMFKQEVPDLVVVVATQSIKTRVVHVGTWRDVNLGVTPQQIIDQQLNVELTPADYDDGFIGRFPPSREEP